MFLIALFIIKTKASKVLKLMAHEDVLISVRTKGGLLLDDGVGDVLVVEDVGLVLAGGVYLIFVAPVT